MGESGEAKKVIIAANPVSGVGHNRRVVEGLCAALVSRGLEPLVVWDAAERKEALRRADAATHRCVIVAGGDGTVGDTLNDKPNLPLAVAPMGTENLFAGAFGFTPDMERLAEAVKRGTCRNADLATVNGRRFSLMVSAGFDAEVVRRTALARKNGRFFGGRGGRALYLGPTLGAFLKYGYPRVRLEADGNVYEGSHVFVFNVPHYAMKLRFVPGASEEDGMLDWLVFEKPGPLRLISYFMAVWAGRHLGRDDVRRGRARNIRITSEKEVPIQVDGDAAGATPAEANVLPLALRLIDCRP